jgi:hypothetical protein
MAYVMAFSLGLLFLALHGFAALLDSRLLLLYARGAAHEFLILLWLSTYPSRAIRAQPGIFWSANAAPFCCPLVASLWDLVNEDAISRVS